MSRLNIPNIREGHRVEGPSNRDLEQKLTYQQLLNFNHDLSKENQQLKNIGTYHNIQPIDSDRNYATYTHSLTSVHDKKTTISTPPSTANPSSITINSPSSPSSKPIKPKYKNSKAASKPSTRNSLTSKRST